jgi:metallo-beta-lactamase family protein
MPLLIPTVLHHGAVDGVTGSCHEYRLASSSEKLALLIDCCLFQGDEKGSRALVQLEIDFNI